MIDFERGAKAAGSKFYFLTGEDALRELNLIYQMVSFWRQRGYTFVIPPYLVNSKTATQAGLLPRFAGDYYETVEGLMLIPTAETPMVGMHAGEILKEAELPLKYVAFSPCFRKESGSYGKRDKGLRRVHQFHKVELFVICTPEDSELLHQQMVSQVQELLTGMGLTHRLVELSPTDRSPVSNKTFDIELKVGDEWLEVSSISNTGENQSGPALIRYKPVGEKKTVRCHMLNGSGVALPRLTLAIQERDGKPAEPPRLDHALQDHLDDLAEKEDAGTTTNTRPD
jgi:seryl-tRNA synthetase